MRIGIMAAAILALVSAASAEDYGHPTAFVVSPIHEAQIVRGNRGAHSAGSRALPPPLDRNHARPLLPQPRY